MDINRYLFFLMLTLCVTGRAHAPAAVPGAKAEGGDLMEVDDKKGVRKPRPMARFSGLAAAVCGALWPRAKNL